MFQQLYKVARLHQLIQQIQLISYMESILLTPLFRKTPDFLQGFLRETLQGLRGRYRYVKTFEPNNYNDNSLPKYLRKKIYQRCLE